MNVTKEKWIIKEGFSRGWEQKIARLSAPLQKEKGAFILAKW